MHGKSTLPLGNNLVFSCGKSENANIFGGHPRTGVPTTLFDSGALNYPLALQICTKMPSPLGKVPRRGGRGYDFGTKSYCRRQSLCLCAANRRIFATSYRPLPTSLRSATFPKGEGLVTLNNHLADEDDWRCFCFANAWIYHKRAVAEATALSVFH